MYRKGVFLGLIFCLNLSLLAGNFEHLGIEEGLSHPWVKAILLDKAGNLWLGTPNGLNKYNGTDIKVFRSSMELRNSLSSEFINALSLGPDGNIWIGTLGGGLNCYIPTLDSFVVYRSAPKIASALPVDNITALFLDSRNQLWVGTNSGLLLYNKEERAFIRNPLKSYGLNVSGTVNQIIEDVVHNAN